VIVLSNGDKWIIDDSEWKEAGIPYEEAKEGNLPITPVEDFIKAVCDYYTTDESHVDPRKWTNRYGGYWDANFDVFKEVFSDIAGHKIENPWSTVYEMPWGKIIVVFYIPDSGGYDCQYLVEIYDNREEYMKQVTFDEE
jgi:hypothetical protein